MLNSSIWRAVLSLFYPPVIIGGKNGKNSENPVGSNKSEKRKPKSAVYRSFWASVVYFHLRLISTKSHKREMTRNRLAGVEPTRGFESHALHQSRARRTMPVRLAFAMLRRSTWSAAFSFWSVRSIMLGNEKSGYRTVSLLCGSRFVFYHSHNGFRYILPKPCGILKSLLESTVKEHGYD